MPRKQSARTPERTITKTYSGSVALTGTGRPTLAELDELVGTAFEAGADGDAEVNGSITTAPTGNGSVDSHGFYDYEYTTYVNLSIAVPAGPADGDSN